MNERFTAGGRNLGCRREQSIEWVESERARAHDESREDDARVTQRREREVEIARKILAREIAWLEKEREVVVMRLRLSENNAAVHL